jgi:predicted nucleotidyltransferase
VDEHDPIGLALLIVRRRDAEREIQAHHAQHDGEAAGPRQDGVGELLIAQRIGVAVHGRQSSIAVTDGERTYRLGMLVAACVCVSIVSNPAHRFEAEMPDTQIAFRSSPEVRERLRELARRQGRSMQAMLEELCDRALAGEGDTPTLAGVIRRLRQHRGELKRLGIAQLYVYGSVARGDARPWSDVDLFADLADEERWNIVRWGHALDRLEEICGRRVDFAAGRSLPEDVRRRANAEAVAVFA